MKVPIVDAVLSQLEQEDELDSGWVFFLLCFFLHGDGLTMACFYFKMSLNPWRQDVWNLHIEMAAWANYDINTPKQFWDKFALKATVASAAATVSTNLVILFFHSI